MTCKWLITMLSKSPKDRVIPLPNGLFMAYKWGTTTYKSRDDPPSIYPINIINIRYRLYKVYMGLIITWRITPVSKWLVTPIYKPFRPFIRGITPFRGLANHGY